MNDMNEWSLFDGTEITLQDVLEAREMRIRMQEKLLQELCADQDGALICFTLNIAGPVKVFPLSKEAFREGAAQIEEALQQAEIRILRKEIVERTAGWEGYVIADGDAQLIKRLMMQIEETHPIGRLFDLDVLNSAGMKMDREQCGGESRTCLICGRPAFLCSRSRSHSVRELQCRTGEMLYNYFSEKKAEEIADTCFQALKAELDTTPKPGLVDRNNSGAHTDMNYELFCESARTLRPWFKTFAMIGMKCYSDSERELFNTLREAGKQAEGDMFAATKGVNTHKGIVFSMAVVCAALGKLYMEAPHKNSTAWTRDGIRQQCADIAVYALEDFRTDLSKYLPVGTSENIGAPGAARRAENPKSAESVESTESVESAENVDNAECVEYVESAENVDNAECVEYVESAGERLYRLHGIGGARREAADGFPAVWENGLPVLQKYLERGWSLNNASVMALLSIMTRAMDTNVMNRADVHTAQKIREQMCCLLAQIRDESDLYLVEEADREFIKGHISPGGAADLLAVTLMLHLFTNTSEL